MPSKIGLVDADLLNSEPACRGGIAYDVPLRGATSPRAPEIEIGGGAPTPALSSVIMVKSDWASAAAGAHARAHTAKAVTVKDRRNEMGRPVPSKRNLLDERVLRRAWTGEFVWRGACVSPMRRNYAGQ